jgi:RNA polymerase sigma-70 factor (ECF subfamily)
MTLTARLTSPAPGDAQVLADIARGNLEALGVLYDRYERAVRRYVGQLGVSAADADDLVQSTFLQVTRAAPSYDGRESSKAWLLGIATLMVRRHRRSLLRRLAHLTSLQRGRHSVSPRTPEQHLETDEAARRFRRAFERLSPKKREVIALVVLQGIAGQRAAESLGIPLNTLWTRLHHARRELRAALEAEAP